MCRQFGYEVGDPVVGRARWMMATLARVVRRERRRNCRRGASWSGRSNSEYTVRERQIASAQRLLAQTGSPISCSGALL